MRAMAGTTNTVREQAFLPLSSDIPAGVTIRQYRAQRPTRPVVARRRRRMIRAKRS
jgi:hypothetical protein